MLSVPLSPLPRSLVLRHHSLMVSLPLLCLPLGLSSFLPPSVSGDNAVCQLSTATQLQNLLHTTVKIFHLKPPVRVTSLLLISSVHTALFASRLPLERLRASPECSCLI